MPPNTTPLFCISRIGIPPTALHATVRHSTTGGDMANNHDSMNSVSALSHGHSATPASTVLSSVAAAAATSTPGHGSHDSAGAAPMAMFFTTSFRTPVLFGGLVPNSTAAAVGLGLAIFLLAVVHRGLVWLRAHLEATRWTHPGGSGSNGGGSSSKEVLHGDGRGAARLVQPFSLRRDAGRMAMAFVTAAVGYALMLIVMSFVVVCFPPSAPRLPR